MFICYAYLLIVRSFIALSVCSLFVGFLVCLHVYLFICLLAQFCLSVCFFVSLFVFLFASSACFSLFVGLFLWLIVCLFFFLFKGVARIFEGGGGSHCVKHYRHGVFATEYYRLLS